MAAQAQQAPLALDPKRIAATDPASLYWRPVTVRGHWTDHDQVLLDNQTIAGQVGYSVYTPLLIDGCNCAVLVNRGWIPIGVNRQAIPDIRLTPSAALIRGTFAPPPASGIGHGIQTIEWLKPGLWRVQRVDFPRLSPALNLRLLPLTIRLDPGESNGYVRRWIAPAGRADRHAAYAVQWFLMGALALGLVLRFHLKPRAEGRQNLGRDNGSN